MFENDIAAAHRETLGRSAKLLSALAQIGGGPIATLLVDMNLASVGAPEMPADLRRYVQGPIICHSAGGWGPEEWESHPVHDPDYKNAIMAERVEIGMGLSKWIIGPCELACVMYAATMAAPLQNDVADLYLWASGYLLKAKGTAYPSGMERITDDEVLNSYRYQHNYREIAWAARRKVIAAQRSREGRGHQAAPAQLAHESAELDLFSGLVVAAE